MPDRAILLHGAWQGAWVWPEVACMLAYQGWTTDAPDLPGNGAGPVAPRDVTFDDHIACLRRLVLSAESPVSIVAHSGAGVLATAIAEAHPDMIRQIVFVCGMMLPSGVTFAEFTAPFVKKDPAARGIVPYLVEGPDGTSVPPDAACKIFYHDAAPELAQAAAARLTVQGNAVRAPRVQWTSDRAGRVPCVYLRCGADRSVLPIVQDAMCAARPGTRIHTLPTGHAPMLGNPELFSKALNESLDAD